MAASADNVVARRNLGQGIRASHPASNVLIYDGALVGLNAGYARNLVKGDSFLGIAAERCDNASGSAGDKKALVEAGLEIKVAVTGASGAANVGAPVYASDSNTFTLTAADNNLVGSVAEHVSGTTCWVKLNTPADNALA